MKSLRFALRKEPRVWSWDFRAKSKIAWGLVEVKPTMAFLIPPCSHTDLLFVVSKIVHTYLDIESGVLVTIHHLHKGVEKKSEEFEI